MKVILLADTAIRIQHVEKATGGTWKYNYAEAPTGADTLAEFAGRACYQSWDRPNEATRKNSDYIRATVAEKGHESITAHASATFYVTGVTRNLTHELIRHRWLAVSELSQRYVDVEQLGMALHPTLDGHLDGENWLQADHEDLQGHFGISTDLYEAIVRALEDKGISGKAAREAARGVLPGMTETRIVITGNMRAWRDFLKQRWHVQADAEIRKLAGLLLAELRLLAPSTFADIPEKPYGTQEPVQTKTAAAVTASPSLTWPQKGALVTITAEDGRTYSFRTSDVCVEAHLS